MKPKKPLDARRACVRALRTHCHESTVPPAWHAANRAEQRRRLGGHCAEHVEDLVRDTPDGQVVLNLDPSAQHHVPPHLWSPVGVLTRRPLDDLLGFLRFEGFPETAAAIETPPPPGHVWVVWIGREGAYVAPWLRARGQRPS